VFIFCRLKINHDFHEFILESGTIPNNYSYIETNQKLFLEPSSSKELKICFKILSRAKKGLVVKKCLIVSSPTGTTGTGFKFEYLSEDEFLFETALG
jgi:hypothetical protein